MAPDQNDWAFIKFHRARQARILAEEDIHRCLENLRSAQATYDSNVNHLGIILAQETTRLHTRIAACQQEIREANATMEAMERNAPPEQMEEWIVRSVESMKR